MAEDTKIILKDSGQRSEFITGARRDIQEGKGRFDLMPVDALIEVGKIYEAGCAKYGDRNWERGIPLSRYIDSGMRHGFKVLRGDTDEPHAAQAAWNWLCFIQTRAWIEQGILPTELNDLPKRVKIETKK